MADIFLRAMQDAGVESADPNNLDWEEIINSDTLARKAPGTWDDVVEVAQRNQWIWNKLFEFMG